MKTHKKKKFFKILTSLILSNCFVYLLLKEPNKSETTTNPKLVKVKIFGKLFTNIERNKKILLIHHQASKKIEAIIESSQKEVDDSIIVKVTESQAEDLLRKNYWKILPYIKNYSLTQRTRKAWHEIIY